MTASRPVAGRATGLGVAILVAWAVVGCKATPPGKFETAVMTRAERALFVGDKKQKNPLAPTAANIALGRRVFSYYCFACHGLDGQNTGVPFATQMSPPVPSLASPAVQGFTDGQLKWIASNGLWPSGMPASKGTLTDDEIWAAVLYIRHLPPPGSLGEPLMYAGEPAATTPSPISPPRTVRMKPAGAPNVGGKRVGVK